MRNVFGSVALFAAGIGVGMFLMQPSAAQQNRIPGMRLNHVGISVKDLGESVHFYTQTMGFREAFAVKDKDGKPVLTYLQINRDTFLELLPSAPDRPVGLNHIGIWPDEFNTTVTALRERGVKVEDPRTGSTKSIITNLYDPNGARLELVDFPPESLQRKAIDGWK